MLLGASLLLHPPYNPRCSGPVSISEVCNYPAVER